MPCGTWKTTDVPSADLGLVIGGYQVEHPLKVETTKQPDGLWTVTATFPPCAAPASAPATRAFAFADVKDHLGLASLGERLNG